MTEREWREASDMRASLVSIGVVIVVAALLRFWHLGRMPPSSDEMQVVGPVLELMRTGAYRPPVLSRPTLPVYLVLAISVLHFIWGALIGAWRTVGDFAAADVIAWGRGCSAFLGTLVVIVVYLIGMRWGARHALLGAGMMAVLPTHVDVSRDIGDGSPLTFFAALALLLSLSAVERPRRGIFFGAGAAAGLAAASAYSGALTLLMPVVAAWMTRSDEGPRGWRALAAAAGAIVAFVVATPRSVMDLPAFLDGVGAAAGSAHFGMMDRVQLGGQLLYALQWPGLLLAIAGIVLGIVRAIGGPGHTRWTILVSFPVIYFVVIAVHGASADTILLPMLPPVAVIAAIAVISGVSLLRRFDIPRAARTALIAALTVAAVVPPAAMSVELVRAAGGPVSARPAAPADTNR